ncbi:MAG TPA: 4-phosphoerythronate dehydrogenase [Bacteroidales bacterium]
MKPIIIIDEHIPYIKGILDEVASVVYMPGRQINAAVVKEADALIIRTRTQCDASLLEGSRVRFIATATIGYDHIDVSYCKQKGIRWTNAPGCNSSSVRQYILAALLLYSREKSYCLSGKVLGVIGVGHVGKKVAEVATLLGMKVLLNDPPRSDAEGSAGFTDLQTIAGEADIISIHTPLIHSGPYPTFHLLDTAFFDSLQRKPLIINTSRGESIATDALKYASINNRISDMIIDCWENEPSPDPFILEHAFIATPHIAGYSVEGKVNGTQMSLDALYGFFKMKGLQPIISVPKPYDTLIDYNSLTHVVLRTYNPFLDSMHLKRSPDDFEYLRENYPLRREPIAYNVINVPLSDRLILQSVGFNLCE